MPSRSPCLGAPALPTFLPHEASFVTRPLPPEAGKIQPTQRKPRAEPHPTPVAQRGIDPAAGASVPQTGPSDPSADLLPTQRKALAVPVVLGGPGQGHGFREVFWNAAQESEAPFWGAHEVPCPEFKNLWGTLRSPSPTWRGWGHRPTQGQDGAAVTQPSPHRPGSGWGLLTSHPPAPTAQPLLSGRKEAAGQLWAWQPGSVCPQRPPGPAPQMPAPPGKAGDDRSWSLINKKKQR